jgi:hypothetical protein
VAASSNSKVYILGGAVQNIQFLSDFYSFPNQISTGTKLNCMNDFFSVYTNDNEIIIINKTNHEVMFQLCDIFGKIIYNHKLIGEKNKLKLENNGANLCTYRIITAELETINGKLIITN